MRAPGGHRVLLALVLVCGLLSLPGAAAHSGSPKESKPDIVLILTDDQRWDTLWAMPEVRRLLVSHGVRFTQGYVSNPLCCPSRTSILTGRYSHSTGIYTNSPPDGGFPAFADASTVGTWIRAATTAWPWPSPSSASSRERAAWVQIDFRYSTRSFFCASVRPSDIVVS